MGLEATEKYLESESGKYMGGWRLRGGVGRCGLGLLQDGQMGGRKGRRRGKMVHTQNTLTDG